MSVHHSRLMVAAAIVCWVAWGSTAGADWAGCESKPTRSCLLEEALRGDSGPLTGKARLDVLIQAGALDHLDYATATDFKEAQRLAKDDPSPLGLKYLYLAIRGLAANNEWQEAFDLVASSSGGLHNLAFAELTRALVNAGAQDRVVPFAKQMPQPFNPNQMVADFVKALVDAGKLDDAQAVIDEGKSKQIDDSSMADMLSAVAQAYAKKGDAKRADEFFHKAESTLQAGLLKPTAGSVRQYDPITLRFALISLLAARGDTAAVKTALAQLPPPEGTTADRAGQEFRMLGYRRIVLTLLRVKQFPLALEVAQSMPGSASDRERVLGDIALADAADGRIDDARTLLASLRGNARIRTPAVEILATALAKAGNIPSALETAAQIDDPIARKATLFAIAHTLPQ